MMEKYENCICGIDTELLNSDKYCFFVLSKILQGECRLTFTDHKRLIICHSRDPYPVWIWLPDDATEEEFERAYTVVKENFGTDGKYRFNAKYKLANFLIECAKKDGYSMKISTNMLVYNCPEPFAPKRAADGECVVAAPDDLEIAAAFMYSFHEDLAMDRSDMDSYRNMARELIEAQRLYFWYDGNNEKVAMTSYSISDDNASIGNVFTRQDKRRRGYAANLVYNVTLTVRELGKIPMLYTDADYEASNACYEGIGYIKQGSLCTIE